MATTDEKLEDVNIDEMFGRKSFLEKAFLICVVANPLAQPVFFIVAGLAFLAVFAGFISPLRSRSR